MLLVVSATTQHVAYELTLHELLASILLEERLVRNGGGEVVDHELQDRLDLVLSIPRIVRQSRVLRTSVWSQLSQ